jgi:tripartite-type tricarboxylate transporter receptor subunit TctC
MRLLLLVVALFAWVAPGKAAYPDKPIKFIVPFSAGGSTDTISRILAQKVSAAIGQSVIIENKPGAGGTLGADLVAKSEPDGYTLLFVGTSTAINQTLYKTLPYNTMRDFEAVIHLVDLNGILVLHPEVPARTVKELVGLSHAKPGTMNFASAGAGTVIHLAGEMFKNQSKADITHVPYKGSGPALMDLMGGRVQMMFANMPGTIQHVKAGKIKVIAVTGTKRSEVLPDVPTISEAGIPGYSATGWFGVMAPAGTPKEAIAKLNAAFNKALSAPELAEILRNEGAETVGGTPEQFRAFMNAEIERWAAVVKSAGAKVN